MKLYSKDQIIKNLGREGVVFLEFMFTRVGNYDVPDADWNYKDIPHVHYVHDSLENSFAIVRDDMVVQYSALKLFGLKLPALSVLYDTAPNIHMLCTTCPFFALIVETRYEQLASGKTKVYTTYCAGFPATLKFIFPILRPLLHGLLKKHYEGLMSTDIPMRERKGQLRSWGYQFKGYNSDGHIPGYNYEESLNIETSNVVIPVALEENETSSYDVKISNVLPDNGEYLLGRADHLGLTLVRNGDGLLVYGRMCPHEGASMDSKDSRKFTKHPCKKGIKIMCPWHGRWFDPIAQFDLARTARQETESQYHSLILTGGALVIRKK